MSIVKLPDLVVADGATESGHIGQSFLDQLDEMVIHVPESVSGTPTVEVTDQDPDDHDSPTWRTLTQPDGTPVPLAADEAVPIPTVSFAGIRVVTDVAPSGSDETFNVTGQDR